MRSGNSREKTRLEEGLWQNVWETRQVTAGSTWIGKYTFEGIIQEIKPILPVLKKKLVVKLPFKMCLNISTFLYMS